MSPFLELGWTFDCGGQDTSLRPGPITGEDASAWLRGTGPPGSQPAPWEKARAACGEARVEGRAGLQPAGCSGTQLSAADARSPRGPRDAAPSSTPPSAVVVLFWALDRSPFLFLGRATHKPPQDLGLCSCPLFQPTGRVSSSGLLNVISGRACLTASLKKLPPAVRTRRQMTVCFIFFPYHLGPCVVTSVLSASPRETVSGRKAEASHSRAPCATGTQSARIPRL